MWYIARIAPMVKVVRRHFNYTSANLIDPSSLSIIFSFHYDLGMFPMNPSCPESVGEHVPAEFTCSSFLLQFDVGLNLPTSQL